MLDLDFMNVMLIRPALGDVLGRRLVPTGPPLGLTREHPAPMVRTVNLNPHDAVAVLVHHCQPRLGDAPLQGHVVLNDAVAAEGDDELVEPPVPPRVALEEDAVEAAPARVVAALRVVAGPVWRVDEVAVVVTPGAAHEAGNLDHPVPDAGVRATLGGRNAV